MDIKREKDAQAQKIIDAVNEYADAFGEEVEIIRHGGIFDNRLKGKDLRMLLDTNKKTCEIQKENGDTIKLKKINLTGVHILIRANG